MRHGHAVEADVAGLPVPVRPSERVHVQHPVRPVSKTARGEPRRRADQLVPDGSAAVHEPRENGPGRLGPHGRHLGEIRFFQVSRIESTRVSSSKNSRQNAARPIP